MRSEALQNWLNQFTSRSEILKNIRDLEKNNEELFEELLREGLTYEEVKSRYTDFSYYKGLKIPEGARALRAVEVYVGIMDFSDPSVMRLPGWHDGNTPSANLIDTSALFGALSKRIERPFLANKTIYSRSNCLIRYTGEALYQLDWDVLHALICFCRGQFNKRFEVRQIDILKMIGLSKAGYNYDLLKDSIVRLRKTDIYIESSSKSPAMSFSIGEVKSLPKGKRRRIDTFSLILEATILDNNVLALTLDARLKFLFGNNEYGLIDWEKRNKLKNNDIAKKIQCLISGQKTNMQRHRMEKLYQLMGLTSSFKEFTRLLKHACEVLLAAGVIKAYAIPAAPRGAGQDRIITIWTTEIPTPEELQAVGRVAAYACGE
ncbi:plasmid replication initiator TrfA [Sutterella sp.]|uniref:plasmid replication initiator TrfA n=1 Tax=Sutterella sp. TaxID=1981025 RepID=UPI003FD8DFEF